MSNIHNVNGCYACTEVKDGMIRLCNNDLCNGRICKTCLPKQLQQKIFTCGLCRQGIVVQKTFNWNAFCKSFGNVFATLMFIILGSSISVLNALGNTILKQDMNCSGKRKCDFNFGWVIPITLFLCMFFWPGRLWSCCIMYPQGKKCNYNCIFGWLSGCGCFPSNYMPKHNWILMNGFIFFVVNTIIMIGHVFGGLSFWLFWGEVEIYTWRSGFAGYVCWLVLIGLGIVIWIMVIIGQCIKDKYSNDEYGVVMDEETYLYTRK